MSTLSLLVQRILNTHFTVRQKQAVRDVLQSLGITSDQTIPNIEDAIDALETTDATLGTMATQDADDVNITGGDIANTVIHGGYRSSLYPSTVLNPGNNAVSRQNGYDGIIYFGSGSTITTLAPATNTLPGQGTNETYILAADGASFDLAHDSGVNGFDLPGATTLTVPDGEYVTLIYDLNGDSRWHVLSKSWTSGSFDATEVTAERLEATTTYANKRFLNSIEASISAQADDWAPTGYDTVSWIKVTPVGAQTITGMAGGADGKRMLLTNVGSFALTITNGSVSSAASNRFSMPGAAPTDLVIPLGGSQEFIYEGTESKWLPIGTV